MCYINKVICFFETDKDIKLFKRQRENTKNIHLKCNIRIMIAFNTKK